MIASALITIQQTEATCPKVKQIRESYKNTISDKHEDSIAKFGAILAQGIIDAGELILKKNLEIYTLVNKITHSWPWVIESNVNKLKPRNTSHCSILPVRR